MGGEVISCDISITNRDATLFTVQEDESQEKSFRLRPVPPPPLPERNVSPHSDDRSSFERQECSSVSSDERDREDRFEGDNERDGEPQREEEEEAPLLHLPPIEVPPLESNRFQTLAVRL